MLRFVSVPNYPAPKYPGAGGNVTSSQDPALYAETIRKILQFHRRLYSYGRKMDAEGISGRKVSALRHLLEAGACTIGELSAYHHISDSTTSEMMAQLESAGYVTRTRSKADNRVVLVDLTSAGRENAQNARLGGIPLLREELKALSRERLSLINEALTDLLRLLETDDDG
jgi:DNA-binding MarR family transcriptional regulator